MHDFVTGKGWHGFDVERLYSNIPQDGDKGLIPTLRNVLTLAWSRHSVQRNSPGTRLLQVFKDTAFGAEWWDVDAVLVDVQLKYGAYSRVTKQGMHNDRWGVDPVRGDFYMFDLEEAVAVLTLLVKFSYVRFGDQVWHQELGIPMGINPAVYMANYYLFYYEYQFLAQFQLLLDSHPPLPGGSCEAFSLFHDQQTTVDHTPVWVHQWPDSVHPSFKGNVVKYILDRFQLMGRFVDDVTSGPNQFLQHLLNHKDTILGGLIKGIYPDCLLLKPTVADFWSFPTLDIRIMSSIVPHYDDDGVLSATYVTSQTVLYDKRRETCYDGTTTAGSPCCTVLSCF